MFEKLGLWARRQLAPQDIDEKLAELPSPPSLSDLDEFEKSRLVVVDLETSGLNVHKDVVLAIGAVVMENGAVDFSDQFETILRQPDVKNDDTVLIHGLGPETLARGEAPEDALMGFLKWAGPAAFIAFHAPFDRKMLSRALKAHIGFAPTYVWLDLADALPALYRDAHVGAGRLDDWLDFFKLDVSERHNAAADALATAQLLLIAIREAKNQGVKTLPQLEEKARLYRRLQENRRGF